VVAGGFFDSPGYLDECGNRHWSSANSQEVCRVCNGKSIIPLAKALEEEKSGGLRAVVRRGKMDCPGCKKPMKAVPGYPKLWRCQNKDCPVITREEKG